MPRLSTMRIRNWVTILVLGLVVASLCLWFVRADRLPRTIHIATGERGGMYFKLGTAIRERVQKRTRGNVVVDSTRGSKENLQRLENKKADLAIVQGGAIPITRVSVITPLFPEFVFVIVRRTSSIRVIPDMVGKAVAIGPKGSGNRISALAVLKQFKVPADKLKQNEAYFKDLLHDKVLDGAIVTAGAEHPDLMEVLSSKEFDLLPIAPAAAIAMVHPFLRSVEIPPGLFVKEPPFPAQPLPTLATTAYLVTRKNGSNRLVRAAVQAIHEEGLRIQIPTLIRRNQAVAWVPTRLHPVASRYFSPSDEIGRMANVMESLAATKELLFALGAGFYLLWLRWRRLKENEREAFISEKKEHLDTFLEKTLEIERDQMVTDELVKLRDFLDQVTRIKLQALQQFTEEQLRGDQSFSIFLDQCAGLISKIQLKIIAKTQAGGG